MGEFPDPQRQQLALLVGVSLPSLPVWEAEDSLDELSRLADTATLKEAERVLQARSRIDPAYYIGKGKAAELKVRARACGADLIIFDNDLSPAQMRNLEDLTEQRILDRSGLILDIFSRHAPPRTAQIQVESEDPIPLDHASIGLALEEQRPGGASRARAIGQGQ